MRTFHNPAFAIFSFFLTSSSGCVFADVKASAISEEVKLLEEIVAIRELAYDRQKLLAEEDRVSDMSRARLALLRARIDLAKEKGELATAVSHLEEIAVIHEKIEKSHQLEAELGKGDSGDLADAKINVLKTRLEIARLKNSIAEESKD